MDAVTNKQIRTTCSEAATAQYAVRDTETALVLDT
jgi:hypothetical protein